MSRLSETMLALLVINSVASVLFLTGMVDVSAAPGFYVVFPLAAVFYGMFLICRALDGEVAGFDAEQRAYHNPAASSNPSESAESLHRRGHHAHAHA